MFLDLKNLEIQLLKFWKANKVDFIYRYKGVIKWHLSPNPNLELIEDLTMSKLLPEVKDIASMDVIPAISDASVSIDDLLAARGIVGDFEFNEIDYQLLQGELLIFWNTYEVSHVAKYKHIVQEYYAGSLRFLYRDISSGDILQMVQNVANYPPNLEFSLEDAITPVYELLKRDAEDFIPSRFTTIAEPPKVKILVVYLSGEEELLEFEGTERGSSLQKAMDMFSKSELEKIAMFRMV